MRRSVFAVLLLTALCEAASPLFAQRVVIDGKLDEDFWRHLVSGRLAPSEAGVPSALGGEIRAAAAGRYLYLSATLPEPGGRVVARSIGVDPVWEGGGESRSMTAPRRFTYGAPEGEDFVQFVLRIYNENDWMIQVGPLGAYSVKWRWTGEREWFDSDPEKRDRFLVATQVGRNEWRVEVAIPLDQLGSSHPGDIQLSVERNRAERPETPEVSWRWPSTQPTAQVNFIPARGHAMPDPVFQPQWIGNREPPLEVGREKALPPIDTGWTDPAWSAVPAWSLRSNEASARSARFATEVKLVHDDQTLAVLARCIEPDRVSARVKERDGAVDREDSFQVYLASSGSAYVEYAINPPGTILDAAGHQGGPRLSRPHPEWNSPVHGWARVESGAWFARLDLPLDAIGKILEEARTPTRWRILLLRRRSGRPGEPQETSVLPVTQSVTPLCPARYRRMELVNAEPSVLPTVPPPERVGRLELVPGRVFSPERRKDLKLDDMLDDYLHSRILKMLEAEKHDWDQVATLSDWERFRDLRLQALRASLGPFPARCPLETHVTGEYRGDGYRRQNLVFQSQPGVWVTANLYLPAENHAPMPGIIILHSLHAPKTQFELQDMGIIWARAGCAVLVFDQVGYGERIETYPWDRENYHSRAVTGNQLYLVGSSLITWMVWDAMRSIDLLCERSDINKNQLILLGAVAGGGDPAAVTAALDSRVAAVVPFNFGESTPEIPRFIPAKNQWPLDLADPGLYDWDSTRVLRRGVVDQFLQWFICASVAPRRFVYSYELGWNVEDLPAWARYRKVFGFYHALDRLADAHGFGPFPGPGEAWNIGPAQRKSLYPTLERWFGIPIPAADTRSSTDENLAARPSVDRRPVSELAVLTSAISAELHRKSLHEIARAQGLAEVTKARDTLAGLAPEARRKRLQDEWATKLGAIEPNRHPEARLVWSREEPGFRVEGISLQVEPGVIVPLLVLRPAARAGVQPAPVVVAVAEGGKELFLAERDREIEALLEGGVAVCLPDVRGTGETSSDFRRDPDGDEITQSNTVLMIGETLLGERLRDLRSVIAYLATRPDLDSTRIGLWGDSFAPPNPDHLLIDELPQWQVSPEIEQQAEPLGGLLALLAGLYEPRVRAVAIHSGLVSFASILDDPFSYVPEDVIVPGILEAGDIADVAAALAPRPLLVTGLVDGRDRVVPEPALGRELQPAFEAYRGAAQAFSARAGGDTSDFADWFIKHWR